MPPKCPMIIRANEIHCRQLPFLILQSFQVPLLQNTYAALRSIISTEGARGIFRGMGPTILTNAPFSALYYMFYSDMKRRLQPVRLSSDPNSLAQGR